MAKRSPERTPRTFFRLVSKDRAIWNAACQRAVRLATSQGPVFLLRICDRLAEWSRRTPALNGSARSYAQVKDPVSRIDRSDRNGVAALPRVGVSRSCALVKSPFSRHDRNDCNDCNGVSAHERVGVSRSCALVKSPFSRHDRNDRNGVSALARVGAARLSVANGAWTQG